MMFQHWVQEAELNWLQFTTNNEIKSNETWVIFHIEFC